MILLTGGSGKLGRVLSKHLDCYVPYRDALDITKPTFRYNFSDVDLIVHCAAYTAVAGAEVEQDLCYTTNVLGTRNLARLGIPMLYISTEYVYDGKTGMYKEEDAPAPINFYGVTKLLGEDEARKRTKTVSIRTLFKPKPYPHPKAFVDQWTSGRYVEEIASEIALASKYFQKLPEVLHIGGPRISIYNLARETRDVEPIFRESVGVKIPRDTSLNTKKWEAIKHDNRLR